MILNETELIKSSREFATKELQKLPEYFYYHNLQHTKKVVASVITIGEHEGIPPDDLEIIIIAAWFHDIGYATNIENHEDESCVIMKKKLQEWGYIEDITVITDIIKATKIPQTPQDKSAKIMCDADLFHLASEDYLEMSEALRKEVNATRNLDLSKDDWNKMSIEFLLKHNYFTKYAKDNLEKKKMINLNILKELVDG